MTTTNDIRAQEEQAWADYDRERLLEVRTPEDLRSPRKQTKQRLAAAGLQEAA